jgi:hypothetical protein
MSVSAENVEPPPGNVHEAPLAGAAKSTRTPFSGVPAGDRSVTSRATGKTVPGVAICGVPPETATVEPGSARTAP